MLLAHHGSFAKAMYSIPWTPLFLGPSLLAWWDPNVGVTVSSSTVSSWLDRTGSNLASQSTASNQFSYAATGINNFPALYSSSDSVKRNLVLASSISATNTSLATMVLPLSGGANLLLALGGNNAEYFGNAGSWFQLRDSGDKGITTASNTTALGSPQLFVSTISSTNLSVAINGSSVLTGTSSSAPIVFTQIGARNAYSQSSTGYIGDVLAINGVISTSVRQKIEGYLSWKYKLSSLLPSSHPYKTRVPYISDP